MPIFIFQTEDLSKKRIANRITEAQNIITDEHRGLLLIRTQAEKEKEEAKAKRIAEREERKK